MELVYLWVEEYKNIKKQGFNFSPRFNCHYDGETKKLIICDKKKKECENNDYIENFFGDNINITAIVGKNGSGKSGILKFLRLLVDNNDDNRKGFIFYFYKEKEEEKFLLKEYGIEPIILDIEKKIVKKYDTHISFPLFDYSFTFDPLIRNNKWHPVYPDKNKNAILFSEELKRNQKNIVNNYRNLEKEKQLEKFKDFFQPTKIAIYIDFSTLSSRKLKNEYQKKYDSLKKEIINSKVIDIGLIKKIKEIADLLKKKESYKENNQNEENFNFDEVDESFPYKFKLGNCYEENEKCCNIWLDNLYCPMDSLENIISINKTKKPLLEKEDVYKLFLLDLDKLKDIDINIIWDSFFSDYFKIELIEKKRRQLSDLSFGEQQLLFILNQLYSLGEKKDIDILAEVEASNQIIIDNGFNEELDYKTSMPINHYIVLLDEIDIGFHPDWQKRTIQYIIDFLSLIPNKSFHLIFATHSPFLLSDILKENIIFLEDGKEDKGISHKQTFGANIHTLLSDGFFMEDGLMGEFAKDKIEEVIDYLNDKESSIDTNDEAQQLINIIGEPIIKNQLQRMLDSKRLVKIDKIDLIEKQIKMLQDELKKVQK